MNDRDGEHHTHDDESRLEEQLLQAQAANRRLLLDFQNRSRNTLSAIRSLLRRTCANSHSVEDVAHNLEGRLGAYGRAQAASLRDPAAGADFASLLSDELLAHAIHEGDNITIGGPELRLQPRAAELFALLFHELVLNAVKFGALRRDAGRVDVSWALTDSKGPVMLVFHWQETNYSAERPVPGSDGFGTELIQQTLQHELGGQGVLTHDAPGSACVVNVPASAILVRALQGAGGEGGATSAPLR